MSWEILSGAATSSEAATTGCKWVNGPYRYRGLNAEGREQYKKAGPETCFFIPLDNLSNAVIVSQAVSQLSIPPIGVGNGYGRQERSCQCVRYAKKLQKIYKTLP